MARIVIMIAFRFELFLFIYLLFWLIIKTDCKYTQKTINHNIFLAKKQKTIAFFLGGSKIYS